VRWAIGLAGGALVVAASWNASDLGTSPNWWAAIGTMVVAVVLAEALPLAQRLMPTPGAVPAALTATTAAVYGCVPETDQIPPIGVFVVALVLVEVVTRRRLRLSWHAGASLLVLWAGIYGATGRPSALVGALFAWWPVVIVPLAAAALPALAVASREPTRWLIAAVGSVAALAVARTGALQPTIEPALVAAAIATAASAAAVVGLAFVGCGAGGQTPPDVRPGSDGDGWPPARTGR
jgi:hypothetical protein